MLTFKIKYDIIVKSSKHGDKLVGIDYDEGPPVPIPNTEVKLIRADNTWLEAARNDKFCQHQKLSPNRVVVLKQILLN